MSKPVPTIRVLREARKLVADPKTWTQHAVARDARGTPISATDPAAVCWCADGAIQKAGAAFGLLTRDLDPLRVALDRLTLRECEGHEYDLSGANDSLGRPTVLAVIDSAIAELESAS